MYAVIVKVLTSACMCMQMLSMSGLLSSPFIFSVHDLVLSISKFGSFESNGHVLTCFGISLPVVFTWSVMACFFVRMFCVGASDTCVFH